MPQAVRSPPPLPTIPFCFESFSDFARRQKAAFKKKWNEPLPWHLWLGLLSQPADTPATASSRQEDRKSTRLNSSHGYISYAVFCLKKKKDRSSVTDIH